MEKLYFSTTLTANSTFLIKYKSQPVCRLAFVLYNIYHKAVTFDYTFNS